MVEKLGDPTAALGAGVLRLDASHPEPPLPAGHLLVAVAAASVNFPDALQVKVCDRGGGAAHNMALHF